ncbi:arom polypeptide [Coprinopsis cinerea AmutBmut pab1-1]|nr:arom polypeptide [Coprinopsis cinerea AmutBmut pab1-1]
MLLESCSISTTSPRGTYVNPPVYNIESDASSATYPLAVAAITGTKCTIENIGSSSLQGDAKFAVEVLQKMGCEVHQTADETTVQGPPLGQLKAIEEVDMEVMTDAFLTASVLAAVANGGENKAMKITGIANQRVKECNRIRAMMDELAKFGVHTTEQELGLTIYAVPISQLKKNVSVHCYDDHRVAMAFSVLSTVVEGAIIEEKRCVEKTWPGWWDDLENKIGIKVEGVDLAGLRAESSSAGVKESKPIDNSSILLIGMRGTGKTHIGQLAAASLPGWSFVDADHYFESKLKTGVKDFVKNEGWEKFREEELAVLAELIGLGVDGKAVSSPSSYSKNHVISLGGGIVETPAARSLLKAYLAKGGRVVHITRPIDEIVRYLNVETARPAYEEPILDVWKRREPWYKECSGWEFGNVVVEAPQGQAQAANVEAGPGKTKCVKTLAGRNEVKRFFGHLAGINPNFTHGGSVEGQQRRTYFLCLTYPDVRHAFPYIDELTEGADALELRVDLLKDAKAPEAPFPSVAYVKDQVTALRRVTGLPIIYTVRTKAQGGAFPDGNAKEYKELVEAGVRLGVEYLDVEVASIFSDKEVADLSKRTKKAGSTLVIASWHDWSGKMQWDGEDVKRKYDEARKFGDLVKIVGKAEKLEDNFKLLSFVKSATSLPNSPPIIAINMSTLGQSSRILNTTFTPVSHPLLPTKAAPGQLSFKQIQQALHLLGLLPSKHFHLFGTPIAHSMSPTLHNTGFELLGLPFKYGLLESKEVDCKEVRDVISDKEGFGGASVTIPFKVDVIELLDELTESAKEIGAVNTIIPVHRSSINAQGQEETTRVLVGDNTDWVGIRVCITQRVSEGELRNENTSGLVIGAGGTARAAIYALQDLGVPVIYLFNRTKEKAEDLAKAFVGGADKKWNGQLVVLDKLGGGWGDVGVAPRVIVSTVPASATALPSASTAAIAGQVDKSTNQIVLPADVFAYTSGSAVVVDMAYKPAETPLLKLAKELKEEGNWACVQGLEVLLEQGYIQFEKWTGRRCPKEQVSTRVWEKYGEV